MLEVVGFSICINNCTNAWEISKRLAKKGVKVDIITRNNGKDNLKKVMNVNIYKLGSQSAITDNFARITFLIKVFINLHLINYRH